VENLSGNTADGSAYHGYWAQNIYEVNSNFGTEADLIALSAALHSRGMYLMVDVVTNHMGYVGCGNCVDYSVFNPFNSVCILS
jgi:alpha-amylase